MAKQKPPFRNTLIITGIIAVFSILFAVVASWNIQSFINTAQVAKGKVIGFKPQRKVYRPVVRFTTAKGDTVTFTTPIGSQDTMIVKTGSPVRVLYHPKSPQDASLDDFWHLWTSLIMIVIFGVAPFLFILLLRFILVDKKINKTM